MWPEMLEKGPSTEYTPINVLWQCTTKFLNENQNDLQSWKDIVALWNQGKVRFRQDPDTKEISVFINGKQSMILYHSEVGYVTKENKWNRNNTDIDFIENLLNEEAVQITTESPAIKNQEQAKALRNSKKALESMDASESDPNTKQFRAAVFLSDIAWMNLVQFLSPEQLPDWVIIKETDLDGRVWMQWVDPYSKLTVDMGGKQKDYGARWRKNADIPFSWAGDLIQDRQALNSLNQDQKKYLIELVLDITEKISQTKKKLLDEYFKNDKNRKTIIQEKKAIRKEENRWPIKLFAWQQARQEFRWDQKELSLEIEYLEYIQNQVEKVERKLNRA